MGVYSFLHWMEGTYKRREFLGSVLCKCILFAHCPTKMSRFASCFIALTVLVSMASLIEGIGFPSGGGGGGCGGGCGGGGGGCGGGGGGCGGGCGRRKRDTAVLPHYKANETPCPQAAWKEIMDENINAEDAVASVNAIQTGLFRRYSEQKFLVLCSAAEEGAKEGAATANKVQYSSGGDGYCNVIKGQTWCQAIALSA